MISFIIPAFNEEESLPRVLESIHAHMPPLYAYERIVVDNGSRDRTAEAAGKLGAKVLVSPGVTVASLRNTGARHASGSIFVFLDADVLITDAWGKSLQAAVEKLGRDPMVVTGSRCGISRPGSWIERSWFEPLAGEKATYINSGHLITTRALFWKLGGFREELETGEDSDFSARARAAGARIINEPALRVIHEGYPKTIGAFIRREMWHGKGAFGSLKSIGRSKTALLSVCFLMLHLAAITAMLVPSMAVLEASAASVVLLCLASSALKFRGRAGHIAVNSFLYYCYFLGRSLALLKAVSRPLKRGWPP